MIIKIMGIWVGFRGTEAWNCSCCFWHCALAPSFDEYDYWFFWWIWLLIMVFLIQTKWLLIMVFFIQTNWKVWSCVRRRPRHGDRPAWVAKLSGGLSGFFSDDYQVANMMMMMITLMVMMTIMMMIAVMVIIKDFYFCLVAPLYIITFAKQMRQKSKNIKTSWFNDATST